MELYPYQQEARAAVERDWESGYLRTLLVLPTGCGKTIVFSRIIEDMVRTGSRCLILAHRGELLEQAADKLYRAAKLRCAVEKAEESCLGSWYRVVVGSIQSLMREKRLSLPEGERRRRAKEWLSGKVMKNRRKTDLLPRIFPKSACTQVEGYMGTSISFWTQERLFAYGVMIKSEAWDGRTDFPTVLAVWEDGTKAIAAHEQWIRTQCEAGCQVFLLDVPGVGAIEQRNMVMNSPNKGSCGTLYTLACNLMYMGDSMAAMRC